LIQFGYHITGGLNLGTSLSTAVNAGFTSAQIFLGPPQRFQKANISLGERELFRRVKKQSGIKVFVHAPYVLHAFARPENVVKNNRTIADFLLECALLDIDGFVLHMGGTKWYAIDGCLDVILELIDHIGMVGDGWMGTPILLENCASGNAMSGDLDQICQLIDKIYAYRSWAHVGLCLDTLHAWAWGYDMTNQDVLTKLCASVKDHLRLIHLNNGPEKVSCGSHYDRHASILTGIIPQHVFSTIVAMLPDVPLIVERDDVQDVLNERDWLMRMFPERMYNPA
jgi:endonuclease IV